MDDEASSQPNGIYFLAGKGDGKFCRNPHINDKNLLHEENGWGL